MFEGQSGTLSLRGSGFCFAVFLLIPDFNVAGEKSKNERVLPQPYWRTWD